MESSRVSECQHRTQTLPRVCTENRCRSRPPCPLAHWHPRSTPIIGPGLPKSTGRSPDAPTRPQRPPRAPPRAGRQRRAHPPPLRARACWNALPGSRASRLLRAANGGAPTRPGAPPPTCSAMLRASPRHSPGRASERASERARRPYQVVQESLSPGGCRGSRRSCPLPRTPARCKGPPIGAIVKRS